MSIDFECEVLLLFLVNMLQMLQVDCRVLKEKKKKNLNL